MKPSDKSLLDRAKRAFLRTQGAPMPSEASYVERRGEDRVAVLVNVDGVLATYHETATLRIRRATADAT